MRKIVGAILSFILGGLILTTNNMTVEGANAYSRVLLSSYEVVEGSFTPGENVTLSLKFTNPNSQKDAYNILITYATDNSNVLPVYGHSNQVYINYIEAKQEKTVEIQLAVPEGITDTEARMGYHVSYSDDTSSSYDYSGTIAAPLYANCQLDVQDIFVSESSVAGDNSLLSLTYENKGKQPLENVTLELKYDDKEEAVELDRLAAEQTENLEHYLVFDTTGQQEINLKMSYTDQNGISYSTDEYTYSVEVMEQSDHIQSETKSSQPEGKGSLYLTGVQLFVMAAVLIAAIIGGIFLFGKNDKFVK